MKSYAGGCLAVESASSFASARVAPKLVQIGERNKQTDKLTGLFLSRSSILTLSPGLSLISLIWSREFLVLSLSLSLSLSLAYAISYRSSLLPHASNPSRLHKEA